MSTKTLDRPPAVTIIGFGPAGFNAALSLRNNGYSGVIRVFSDHETLPYSPILTSYYAGGERTFEECLPWTQDEVDALDLEIHASCPVTKLDVSTHSVETPEGDFPFTKCIIATGATPSLVGFPQDCGYKPHVLHTLEDAERMRQTLAHPSQKRVLVSGASMIAVKMLEAALAQNNKCTLVGMNSHILDMTALPEAASRFQDKLANAGVEFRFDQTIKDVTILNDDKLEVTFSNGGVDIFDEIFVAHGMKSCMDFIVPDSIDVDRGILVDEFMRSSHPDVYAAGDIAQAYEPISGKRKVTGIWKNAVEQGVCAGRSVAFELAGSVPDMPHAGSLASNTISCCGALFISAGTIEMKPSRFVEVREGDDMTVVYVYESDSEKNPRRLVGFNIASDTDEEGGRAYDVGAMLTLRIEEALK